ncbi:MAG: NAD(P)-dependent alcohol dehydrogenase [Acidimicrobiaceae bacterium]|nr:NAD(P)-dependent alcohol dehydrogenase [Acidimicrobiaceae bacterium]
MRALRLTAWKADPSLVEVAEPVAGPGEVVVRIAGAGACHSDLHLMHDFDASMAPWSLPFTLGHENAGWVHELGPGVSELSVGQPVAVSGAWGCGQCDRCRAGLENYCSHPEIAGPSGGLGRDGGMAELLLVPAARHLVPLPAGLDPVSAAPLTDAGLTPYHAIRRSEAKLGEGSNAVVIGVGGLGHLAVQLLAATVPARIIAVDARAVALELARAAGAADCVEAGPDAATAIREATSGQGADVVLDFVGLDATMALAASVARPLGDVTIVGIGGGTLPVSFFSVPYEVSIQTTYWGNRWELESLLALAAQGKVRPQVTTYPLEQAVDVYHQLEGGHIAGRAVIEP